MAVEHFIVFIGALEALATELSRLEGRIAKSRVVAPAVKKKHVGVSDVAIKIAADKLHDELSTDSQPSQVARLYLWMYTPSTAEQLEQVLEAFGHASWIETIPTSYQHKVGPTKEYLEKRTREIRTLLHHVSDSTYAQRKSSPLSLPLRNFTSSMTDDLKKYWYNGLDEENLKKSIKRFKNKYQQRWNSANQGYRDNKKLIFRPAKDTECHGMPHPKSSEYRTYFCGRFRSGVSLFPGFHFDVSSEKSPTIQCDLWTSSRNRRYVSNRTYVNIFPNDYILPDK